MRLLLVDGHNGLHCALELPCGEVLSKLGQVGIQVELFQFMAFLQQPWVLQGLISSEALRWIYCMYVLYVRMYVCMYVCMYASMYSMYT